MMMLANYEHYFYINARDIVKACYPSRSTDIKVLQWEQDAGGSKHDEILSLYQGATRINDSILVFVDFFTNIPKKAENRDTRV